jgi:hypothetical protein
MIDNVPTNTMVLIIVPGIIILDVLENVLNVIMVVFKSSSHHADN